MEINSYGHFWDHKATSPDSAILSVDGSFGEDVVRITGAFTAKQMIAALEISGDDRVLELGCGVGRIGRELAPHCGHWSGVDISGNMVAHARERLRHLDNINLHPLQRTSLDVIGDGSLDKVYSVAVLCHMDKEDLFLYLKELHQKIRSGGLAYVETWNLLNPIGWRRWEYEVGQWKRSTQQHRKDVARNQFCTPDEFLLYVTRAGFTTLAGYSDSPWIQIVAARDPTPEDEARQRLRLKEMASSIAYSKLFSRLFELTMYVTYRALHPSEVLKFLDGQPVQPETLLFRPYIEAIWKNNPHIWGPFPNPSE